MHVIVHARIPLLMYAVNVVNQSSTGRVGL